MTSGLKILFKCPVYGRYKRQNVKIKKKNRKNIYTFNKKYTIRECPKTGFLTFSRLCLLRGENFDAVC